LEFGDVTYWDELREVMDWTQTNVHASFGVCWGGMAMINHFHGVKKHLLDRKAFGCFPHHNFAPSSPFLLGFSDEVLVPVSRWTEMRQEEIDAAPGLTTPLGSEEVGACLVDDPAHRALYVFNHFEYDNDTLKQEYDRDVANGTPINVPANYYPEDDPARPPMNRWRSHAHLLYGNWINAI
ncbi:homoserine O-succinyltransferase, partial [Thioclava sp. BHET1]